MQAMGMRDFRTLYCGKSMITNLDFRTSIGPDLRLHHLEPYWSEYFTFERETPDLHQIAEEELSSEIETERNKAQPFIDAQRSISRVLTDLGPRHNFHRQFNDAFEQSKAAPVLGMHLYALLARDIRYWVYTPTQHAGHRFPHATYFIPAANAAYTRFVREHEA